MLPHKNAIELEPVWNLYVAIDRDNGKVLDIIMPNDYGVMEHQQPKPDPYWHAVKWPCNPHFTGKAMIQEIIEKRWKYGRTKATA